MAMSESSLAVAKRSPSGGVAGLVTSQISCVEQSHFRRRNHFGDTPLGEWESIEAYAEYLLDELGARRVIDDSPEWLKPRRQ